MPSLNTRRLSVSLRATLALCLIPLITATAGAATPAVPAAQVAGAAGTHHYAIPPQPLYSALDALAEQAGLQIVYSAELVQALDSRGLTGDYTPEDALTRLLAGTGLEYRYTGPGTVTLARRNPLDALPAEVTRPRQYAGDAEPAPKKPEAPPKKDEDELTVLPVMTVTGEPWGDTSYNILDATTATKTDTPIMETPVSVQVVPQQVLQDQQVYRLEDALQNVSGVQFATSSNNEFDSFFIRGFADTSAQLQRYRNGVRLPAIGKSDLTNTERIEVLKGPAAMLYGRVEPGGIINLVTKKPLTEPYYSLQQEFGSYDFYRTSLDATGPLTSDRSLLYRFNLGYLDTESFRDFVFQERIFLAPSLTWRPREDTEFNLDFEYLNEDWFPDSGIPALSDGLVPIPITRQLAEPGSKDEFENYLVDFNWSHRFNEHWTLRNGVNAQLLNNFFLELFSSGVLVDLEDKRTVNRGIFTGPFDRDQYTVFADLTGQFQLLEMDHQVLLGADYYDIKNEGSVFLNLDGRFSIPIDLFSPVYGTVDVNAIKAQPPIFSTRVVRAGMGLYFQDQITIWDKLHILGGGRYDWAERSRGSSTTSFDAIRETTFEEEAFSPRVGLLYQPWPWLSLYGNYVESFGVTNGFSASGEPLPAQRGQQYEVGVKTELFNGRLTSTLAFYHLTKTNLLAADLSTPDRFDSVAVGEARSRGIELDVSGRLTDRLSVIGTYAFTDTEITKDQGQDEFGNPTPSFQLER